MSASNQNDQRAYRDSNASNGAVSLSSGVAYSGAIPLRAVFITCTSSGTATFTFVDGSTIVTTLPTGLYEFNWHITTVTTGTATATYYGLV